MENEKKETKEKKVMELPVFDDIREQYEKAEEGMLKGLLLELTVTRVLKEEKNLRKYLGRTFDNRRAEDGSIQHLAGFYIAESMSERDADDFIISGKGDISRMWICDKYGKVAQMLK